MSETAPAHPSPSGSGPSGRAIATLVLGILSLIPCALFLTGIPAILMGRRELGAVRAGRANASGKTYARVGYVLGMIGSGFGGVLLLAWLLLVGLGLFVDGL